MVKHHLQRSGKCFVWQMFEYSQDSALHPCPRAKDNCRWTSIGWVASIYRLSQEVLDQSLPSPGREPGSRAGRSPVIRSCAGRFVTRSPGRFRPFVRFFACKEDPSHYPAGQRLIRSYRLWWGAVPGHRRHCRRLEEEALTRAVCAGLSERANVPSKKTVLRIAVWSRPPIAE